MYITCVEQDDLYDNTSIKTSSLSMVGIDLLENF